MEMHQIRYALAVHAHRNFTHAAKASNVSQPALTAAIAKLEAELGGALFLRDRSGCSPTALGRLMRPRFESIIAEHEAARSDAVRHVRLDRVPITIGVGETIGTSRLIPALAAFRRTHPRADIELIIADRTGLLAGLDEGRLEVAVLAAAGIELDLYSVRPIYDERYVVALGAGHPLAGRPELCLADLSDTDLLDRLNCEMREELFSMCGARGVVLYAAYRSNRIDWLVRMAAEGMGVVVIPETAIPGGGSLVTRLLTDAPLTRTVAAIRRRHQPSRPEIERLIGTLSIG
jgi:LysR family transcriptional regulator, hydrogen peroxide-inducible genes activator